MDKSLTTGSPQAGQPVGPKGEFAAKPQAAKAPVDTGYTENAWQGLPHFQCNSCVFDSLDEAAMVAHINGPRTREHSVWGHPAAPAMSSLIGPGG